MNDIPMVVLNPDETYIVPDNDLINSIKFIGGLGTRSTLVINTLPFVVVNLGNKPYWDAYGKTPALFNMVQEQIYQLAVDNLYRVKWESDDYILTVQKILGYDAQLIKSQYRFNGSRYSFRGTETHGPDDIIPEIPSLYPFPAVNNTEERIINNDHNISILPFF